MKKESQVIFDRNVVEFVTVAAEFCKFLEQAETMKRDTFVDTSLTVSYTHLTLPTTERV